ncbi:MAG: sulfatase-like hydrolase/transferase [Verrucomicrobiota bacterium]
MSLSRFLLPLLLLSALGNANEHPNVILILADDLAIGDLASRNGGLSMTPRLDTLATEGVAFETAYSSSPVCAPARATLLTGRYPHRTGPVSLNQLKEPELTQLKREEVTLADRFHESGYVTGLVGKWHLGLGKPFHPLERGFAEFVGFLNNTMVDTYFDYRLEHQGEVRTYFNDEYLTDVLNQEAIEFMRRHRDEPFFLHLAHYAPHRPLSAPEEVVACYLEKGLHSDIAHVYAMNEIMDRGIGELLDELEELGLAEKTLIFFASDNGPDSLIESRFNEPHRGTKYMITEGGIRVPLFVRWKGRISPGSIAETVHFADLVPTLIEICQLEEIPGAPRLDGVSFAELLGLSKKAFSPPARRFWQWNRSHPRITHNGAVREGNWKLVKPFVTKNYPKGPSDLPFRLYDLSTDPGETVDLSGQYPELQERLSRDFRIWFEEVERDRTGIEPNASRNNPARQRP